MMDLVEKVEERFICLETILDIVLIVMTLSLMISAYILI